MQSTIPVLAALDLGIVNENQVTQITPLMQVTSHLSQLIKTKLTAVLPFIETDLVSSKLEDRANIFCGYFSEQYSLATNACKLLTFTV